MLSGRNALLAMALLNLASPAHAALKLCNRTTTILYAATSSVVSPRSTTHGWTRIAPGDCQVAIIGKLDAQSTLVYAHTGLAYRGPERSWGGNFPACVRDGDFTLRQAVTQPYCTGPLFAVPFAAVDTHGRADWTMTFDETPQLSSLEVAQLAGVKRLLKENGYRIGAVDGTPDKATEAALRAFRKTMAGGARAGNDALFSALEQGAIGDGAAPDGVTACNDGKGELAVAVAEARGADVASLGWWRIGKGACARLITLALNGAKVWLRAEPPGGSVSVSGEEKFCVAPRAFEIKGRNCAPSARQAFQPVPAPGEGVLIHIGAKGIVRGIVR